MSSSRERRRQLGAQRDTPLLFADTGKNRSHLIMERFTVVQLPFEAARPDLCLVERCVIRSRVCHFPP